MRYDKMTLTEYLLLTVTVFLTIVTLLASSSTNPRDVAALQDLYTTLNFPPQLKGWRVNGGDPCEELWTGVACSGPSILYLKIQGLNLSGYLGAQLQNLHHLKHLDVSSNNILGEIPYGLPPNATHINMACNYLTQNLPHSIPMMKNLRHMNLSHNALSGPIGDVFTDLNNLKEMDLSYNNITGDLPKSVSSLTKLTRLFLQSNNFSGSVTYLAELPLTDLNIQDNSFSGIIPRHFQSIPNLWIDGNKFYRDYDSPPWDFPLDTIPAGRNISAPPSSQASAIENYPSLGRVGHKKKNMGAGGIIFTVGGVALLVTGLTLIIPLRKKRVHARKTKRLTDINTPLEKLPISVQTEERSPQSPVFNTQPLPPPNLASRTNANRKSRRSFVRKCRVPDKAKVYTVAELQLATGSFSEDNLLGEGSLGSVYRAAFPDGQVFAVKNIDMGCLSLNEAEKFLDVICTTSSLRHPNIVSLQGYCLENGQHMLVYEYVGNLSLDDALHSKPNKPLSWSVRLRIALGVAQALDYMHRKLSPPVAHSNLKATNVLLDGDFMPHICDCCLAVLRPLTSIRVKIKASEIAISDTGYTAPEHGESGGDNTKNDIYAFGVLLLELLTGRKPFDNSKRKEEQFQVRWASSRLHDIEFLQQIVDPDLQKTLSAKELSRFADIVSLCLQHLKEYRPPMSEIVESLTSLQQNHVEDDTTEAADGAIKLDLFERYSFRSTNTRFLSSPAKSFKSARTHI